MRRAAGFALFLWLVGGASPGQSAYGPAPPQTSPAAAQPEAAAGQADAAIAPDRIERFLADAQIIDARPIGKGVTSPWRLTLSDGTLTHDAAFQSVNRERENVKFSGGREEKLFKDYYGYNIAAYKLARLMGQDDLVPVTVERTWKGTKGALTWWIHKKWDEDERLKAGAQPTDRAAWELQVYRARVFTALVEDTDRNLGNQLVTADFHLWMIDFTRAFRRAASLQHPEILRKIDRQLFERLRALSTDEIAAAVKPYVEREELHGLVARRNALIKHFTKIAAERGDALVFY